jgi:cell division protein FtsA
VGLRTPASEAEKIKQKYGCVLTSLVRKEETIEVPSVGGRNPRILSRQILSEILEPRVEEIFGLARRRTHVRVMRKEWLLACTLTGAAPVLKAWRNSRTGF